jgi:SRSO17 transposase
MLNWTRHEYRTSMPQLAAFLSPLVARIGRKERKLAAARYVAGLLLPGKHKSIRSLADWLDVDRQGLQQFLTDSPWDYDCLWKAMRSSHLGPPRLIDLWIVQARHWRKQGTHSVGVTTDEGANKTKKLRGQISIEILAGYRSMATPLASRLYLSHEWDDTEKRHGVRIPSSVTVETKSALATRLIRETLQDGVCRAPVVAESEFGDDWSFREALRELGVEFFLAIDVERHADWRIIVPCNQGRTLILNCPLPVNEVIQSIPSHAWEHDFSTSALFFQQRRVLWKRVILYRGPQLREALWLVIALQHDSGKFRGAYLCDLHRPPTDELCTKLMRSSECVRTYNRCFDDILDLASYQGRTWDGFHHHLVLAAIACSFIFINQLGKGIPDTQSQTALDLVIADEVIRLTSLL